MRDDVLHGFKQFDETGRLTPQLSAIMKQMPLSSVFGMEPQSTSTGTRDSTVCLTCLAAVNVMKQYMGNHSKEEVFELIRTLCVELTEYSDEVCAGSIGLHLVNEFHS
jgi:alpha-glucuronidase